MLGFYVLFAYSVVDQARYCETHLVLGNPFGKSCNQFENDLRLFKSQKD
jgi:hypothetical protein